uniref:Uncharacterized protein n=1 Tax=Rousettus aegyptiacus TaxID=9407 RepID=A0A7J8B8C3_ROUAE|nr:hypothetical protein HJG63_010050 [Rousettus aegyptiacus]
MSPPTDVTSLGAFVYPGCCKQRGPCLSSLLLFGGDTPQPTRATDTPISSAYWDPKATEVTWGPRASSAPARAPFRSLRLLATVGLPWGCVPQHEAPGWLLWSRLRMPIALPASLPKKCIPCAHLFSVKETGARVCPRPRPWGGGGGRVTHLSGGMLVPWARQKIRPSRLQARRPASPAGTRSCRRLLESREQACGWTDAPVRARTRRRFGRVRHHHASWTPPGRTAATSTIARGPRFRNHGADFCTRSWRGNPNRPMAASLLAFFFLFFSRRDPIQILPDNELKQPRRPKQNKPTAKALLLPGAEPRTRFYPNTLGPRGPRTRRRV